MIPCRCRAILPCDCLEESVQRTVKNGKSEVVSPGTDIEGSESGDKTDGGSGVTDTAVSGSVSTAGVASVGDGVASVGDDVASVGDGVASVGDGVASVGDGVASVGDGVASVGDGVASVGDGVAGSGGLPAGDHEKVEKGIMQRLRLMVDKMYDYLGPIGLWNAALTLLMLAYYGKNQFWDSGSAHRGRVGGTRCPPRRVTPPEPCCASCKCFDRPRILKQRLKWPEDPKPCP